MQDHVQKQPQRGLNLTVRKVPRLDVSRPQAYSQIAPAYGARDYQGHRPGDAPPYQISGPSNNDSILLVNVTLVYGDEAVVVNVGDFALGNVSYDVMGNPDFHNPAFTQPMLAAGEILRQRTLEVLDLPDTVHENGSSVYNNLSLDDLRLLLKTDFAHALMKAIARQSAIHYSFGDREARSDVTDSRPARPGHAHTIPEVTSDSPNWINRQSGYGTRAEHFDPRSASSIEPVVERSTSELPARVTLVLEPNKVQHFNPGTLIDIRVGEIEGSLTETIRLAAHELAKRLSLKDRVYYLIVDFEGNVDRIVGVVESEDFEDEIFVVCEDFSARGFRPEEQIAVQNFTDRPHFKIPASGLEAHIKNSLVPTSLTSGYGEASQIVLVVKA